MKIIIANDEKLKVIKSLLDMEGDEENYGLVAQAIIELDLIKERLIKLYKAGINYE